jgi:hypothetical protein
MNSTDLDARSTTSSTTRSSRDSWWDLMIDDEEEEDEEELTRQQTTQAIVTSTVMAATWSFLQLLHQHNIERRPLFTSRRVNWEEHVRDLLKEGNEFRKDYRMSHASFNKLCNILRPSIQVDEEMSRRRTGQEPISPEMMLHCLIRYLAGGSLRDIRPLPKGTAHCWLYQSPALYDWLCSRWQQNHLQTCHKKEC